MHDNLRHHTSQKKSEETDGKLEIGPVVSIFHYFQCIAFEINCAIKVHLVKCLHRYLAFAMIPSSIALTMKLEVVLHRATWVASFLVLSRRQGGSKIPVCCKYWYGSEDCEEHPCKQTAPNLTPKKSRHRNQQDT